MNRNSPDAGVVYYAIGEKWTGEMVRSARSVKACMPELPIAVFCDSDLLREAIFDETPESLFDFILPLHDSINVKQAKMHTLLNSPFERTLYLDTDTLVVEPVWEIFELLDQFGLAACVSPFWAITKYKHHPKNDPMGVPVAFPKINSGVLAFRKNDQMQRFILEWQERHRAGGGGQDQPSLRQTLYWSDVRYATMPAAYNYRLGYPSGLGGIVKIFHGRSDNFEAVCRQINATEKWRATTPTKYIHHLVEY